MVPPGRSSPLASAASIILIAMRSLALPPGLRYSILAATMPAPSGTRVQLYQQGIADELTDVPRDPHASMVSGGQNGYQVASRM